MRVDVKFSVVGRDADEVDKRAREQLVKFAGKRDYSTHRIRAYPKLSTWQEGAVIMWEAEVEALIE